MATEKTATSLLPCLLPLALLFACADGSEPELGDGGELRVGLWGQGSSGELYSLHGGLVMPEFGGTWNLDWGDSATLSFPYDPGPHSIELVDWYVLRGAPDEPNPVMADATLVTMNPVAFTIAEGLSTPVTFEFEIDGDAVPFVSGAVEIDAEFDEDDGVCMPVPSSEAVLVAFEINLGGADGLGDGWQSFTSTRDGMITTLGLSALADPDSEGYTVEIREGVGDDGALLGIVEFPCDRAGMLAWDRCPATTEVVLEERAVYSLVSHGVSIWSSSNGAMPGATSSEGDNRYRIFELDALECD